MIQPPIPSDTRPSGHMQPDVQPLLICKGTKMEEESKRAEVYLCVLGSGEFCTYTSHVQCAAALLTLGAGGPRFSTGAVKINHGGDAG